MSMLSVNNISASYGSIQALKGVSLEVDQGEMVAVVGANGAGKSTLLKCILGLLETTGGSISFLGQDITNASSDRIVKMGLAMVPEGRQIFSGLSVMENLKMGAYSRSRKDNIEPDIERVFSIFPQLKERSQQKGGSLSGGEQQMLAVGRALMAKPKMLLLDELSMGLAPIMVESLFASILEIKAGGVTTILIEQDAMLALQHADRAYVLETGVVALEGQASQLLNDDRMRAVYLGG
jgi:branched-chain amino acid transport system ATP-binding protein